MDHLDPKQECVYRALQVQPRHLGQTNELMLIAYGPGCFLRLLFGVCFLGLSFLGVWDASADLLVKFVGKEVQAKVIDVDYTDTSINDRDVMMILFEYEVDGQMYENVNYASKSVPSTGVWRKARYLPSVPFVSCLEKASNGMIGVIGFLIAASIVGLVGLFSLLGFRKVLFWRRLLRQGKAATAVFVDKKPTNTSINEETVYKLIFAFDSSEGQTHELTVKEHKSAKIKALSKGEKLVLYLPQQPDRALLWDELPVEMDVDQNGLFRPAGNGLGFGLVLIVLTFGSFFFGLWRLARLYLPG